MSDTMKNFEKRIAAIEARNRKVELDKAWETSWTRRIAIALLTYVVVCMYLAFVIHIDPWLNALVPVVGFILSTLALERVKKIWQEK
ncbi:MAG: hypothetical protein WAU02_04710 [Candidatus Saccharimonadales bacterium]